MDHSDDHFITKNCIFISTSTFPFFFVCNLQLHLVTDMLSHAAPINDGFMLFK